MRLFLWWRQNCIKSSRMRKNSIIMNLSIAKCLIYDAKEIFKDNLEEGIKIDALLVTENGKEEEGLLGIVTRWDFLRIQ